MKKFFLLLLIFIVNSTASMTPNWSKDFFGSIYQLEFSDINGDGSQEIVVGAKSGIFTLKEDGTFLWSDQNTHSINTLIPFQADGDSHSEFAALGWMEARVFDNSGAELTVQSLSPFSTSKLPAAILNNRLVSYYKEDFNPAGSGLLFVGTYPILYQSGNIPSNGLAGVDSNSNGINDLLFGVADMNASFCLDKDGNEVWRKEIALDQYDNITYLWAGKLNNGSIIQIIGTTYGVLYAYDQDGNRLWKHDLDLYPIKTIIKDHDGGFLVTVDGRSFFSSAAVNNIYKIDESNGSILWSNLNNNNFYTKAMTQDRSQIAAGFSSAVKIFNESGTQLQEFNISTPTNNDSLDVHALKFGSLGSKSGLFVGTVDIHRIYNDTLEKIYAGGQLVSRVAAGDMNGDGVDEIAVYDGLRLYLYRADGTLLWMKDDYLLFENISFANLSGDKSLELITGHAGDVSIINYAGDVLWSRAAYYSNIYPMVVLEDYDDDGLDDLFISRRDSATQKFPIDAWSGKDGSNLHEYGISEFNYFLNIFDVNGAKRLYYSEYTHIYWVELKSTFASRKSSSINLQDTKLNDYADVNADSVVDFATGTQVSNTSLNVSLYDLTKDAAQTLITSVAISTQESANDLKLYDYNGDGTYEILLIFPSKVALYNLEGGVVWEREIADQYGGHRMLSDVKIVETLSGDRLFVSGKEVYILDKAGNKLQELSHPNYMSTAGYYLPIAFAKTSNTDLQLILGAMGLYSYTGIEILASNPSGFLPAILYLLF